MSLAQQFRAWGTGYSPATLKLDIDDEMEFHIQSRIDDLVQHGVPGEAAAEQANQEFGDRGQLSAACQRIHGASQLWMIRLAAAGLAMALGTIGWLGWSLYTVQNENLNLTAKLNAGLASLASPVSETLLASASANDDLAGKVLDSDGNGVAGAKVLLLHKSWPNRRYQQNKFETTTDKNGKYRFDGQYARNMQNAFLVTILADGHEMQSKYKVVDAGKEAIGFDFRLKSVEPVKFQFVDSNGPLSGTPVFVHTRNVGPREHMIYYQSQDSATWETDDDGNIDFGFFAPGDKVKFAVQVDGEWQEILVKIGKGPEQRVNLDGDSNGSLLGKVTDSGGDPIANARVLLVHKSWPNNRYQQRVFDTTTDDKGAYRFPDQFTSDMRNAFLVTIFADGHEMQSTYEVIDEGAEVPAFDFGLNSVDPTSLTFVDASGDPLADTPVFVNRRQTDDGDEHVAYFQNNDGATWNTDGAGQLSLGFFAPGDEVRFAVQIDGEWQEATVTIADTSAGQTVYVKKKWSSRRALASGGGCQRPVPDPVDSQRGCFLSIDRPCGR